MLERYANPSYGRQEPPDESVEWNKFAFVRQLRWNNEVAHPTDEGGYPVRQLPPLMFSSVAAVERSQPQAPPTAPTLTAAYPKLISNSSKRKDSMGGGWRDKEVGEDPPSQLRLCMERKDLDPRMYVRYTYMDVH